LPAPRARLGPLSHARARPLHVRLLHPPRWRNHGGQWSAGGHGDPQGSRRRGPALKADVVVIGGGHNALVAAARVAKGGLSPLVLERRDVLGGAALTEEIGRGFKVSTLAHTAGPLRHSLVKELGLSLQLIAPEPRLFASMPDGRALLLWGDARK